MFAFLLCLSSRRSDVTPELWSRKIQRMCFQKAVKPGECDCLCGKIISQAIALRDQNSGNKNRSILKTAVDFIDSHYMEEDMSLNKAANAANVSANHFSALFSQNMGQTFIEYLTNLRMNKAKEYLRARVCDPVRSRVRLVTKMHTISATCSKRHRE